MPFLTIDGRTVYRDGTFGRGAHPPAAAAVREAPPFKDPSFRKPGPEPGLSPFLAWLLGTEADTDWGKRAIAADRSGRILLGRAISEHADDVGDTILMRGLPRLADGKVYHKHYEGVSVGRSRIFRRQTDGLACLILDDNLGGHTLASEVAAGRLSYLSVAGTVKARTGKTITRFLPTDVSLTDSPADPSCCVMGLNDPHFDEFARVVLGLKGVLPWL